MAIVDSKNSPQDEKDKKISLLLEDLAALESYIHDLFVFSPLPICFVSPLGVILEANPAFEKISNFSFDEIIGESIEKLFQKEEIENLTKDTFKKGLVKGREMELLPKRKKSLVCQVFTRIRKDEKGEVVGFFFGLFDLREIKKTEKELKESRTALMNMLEDTEEARKEAEKKTLQLWQKTQVLKTRTKELEESRVALMNMLGNVKEARKKAEEERDKTNTIITNFADGLLVFDLENKLALINPRAEVFFKIKSREVIGKSVLELDSFPNLKPLIILLGKPSLKTGVAREIKEMSKKELLLEKDLILEVSTISIMVGEERTGTLVVLHDVTREKIVEKLKTEFVSLSAHQLRTPLSAIKWTLQMLLDEDLGEITKEQREFIEKIYESNEKMIKLINDLLDVTRIEEGRYLYRPVLASLENEVQFVVNSYKEEIEKRKLKLEFKEPKKKLPQVMLDVEKMRLAIQNLLDNAIRYTHSGGQVTISLKGDKNKVEFRISDTGIGIPKDQQKRVFTKFFRGANAVKIETGGTGLGLYITKNIIEAHDGKILFKSEEGKGSTFYFSLPCGETT